MTTEPRTELAVIVEAIIPEWKPAWCQKCGGTTAHVQGKCARCTCEHGTPLTQVCTACLDDKGLL